MINGKLSFCRSYQQHFLTHSDLIRRILDEQPISEVESLSIRTLLRNCTNTFLALHELLVFLPQESIHEELRFYCERLFHPKFSHDSISVILTSLYNAFEYSLDDVIHSLDVLMTKIPDPNKLPFGDVMELAIVDRDNPLSWPILAHEFGHYLDKQNGISSRLAKKFVEEELKDGTNHRLYEPIAAELFADLVAYYLQGPCSVLPLLRMELCADLATDNPSYFDGIHPPTTSRLQMVRNASAEQQVDLGFFTPYIDAHTQDEQIKAATRSKEENETKLLIERHVEVLACFLAEPYAKEIQSQGLRQFDGHNFAESNSLKQRLEDGVPIGARRKAPNRDILNSLDKLTSDSTVDECRDTFRLLKEEPVHVSEILTAGWMVNCDNQVNRLRIAFEHPNQEEVFPLIQNGLEDQDKLLRKSIEMVEVIGDK